LMPTSQARWNAGPITKAVRKRAVFDFANVIHR
jgi:hypothetical protein